MSEDFRVAETAMAAKWKTDRRRKTVVTVIRVHPLVWAAAMEAAGFGATRLVVESPTSVTVLNKGKK